MVNRPPWIPIYAAQIQNYGGRQRKDRAIMRAHDIGLLLKKRGAEIGFEVIIVGRLGRTPMIDKTLCDFLPKSDLLL